MSNIASKILTFVAGAGIGSFLSWYFTKNKYEKLAQEEIAIVREYYRKKNDDEEPKQEEVKPAASKLEDPDVEVYIHRVADLGYGPALEHNDCSVPYVIEPEAFDTIGYETVTLSYYADDILADEEDKILPNAESAVGLLFADHFGEYEEDTVFIRNDALRIDFEICRDTRNYYDVAAPGDYLE
jgi:hypothetical protein